MKETMLTRKDAKIGVGLFDSIAWAFSEHVKQPDRLEINSAVLYGNEDCPEGIDFYTELAPLMDSKPVFMWVCLL